MQRSSHSVGALAAALAKAQAEIQNPKKSLTATIVSPFPREGMRSFRYASLSSGLDLVRKCLGQHEIATVQATAIDQDNGLIRLTTTLVHASGEWVSSDWPVCPVSETAAPHRLGAALTYARRYALFTLVGIAGEDDLDAPDLVPAVAAQPPVSRVLSGPAPAAAKRTRADRPSSPQLEPGASEQVKQQLVSELKQLGDGEALAAWAHRVLPLKSQLSPSDCHALEAGFVARLRELGEVPGEDGSKAQEANAKEPERGRAKPAHTIVTVIAKPVRERDRNHLRFVASQPCLVCGRSPCDPPPHQVCRAAGDGAQGQRPLYRPPLPAAPSGAASPRQRTCLVADVRGRSVGRCGKAMGRDTCAQRCRGKHGGRSSQHSPKPQWAAAVQQWGSSRWSASD